MDYIEIILRGYANDNDKQFLSKYFVRESKKAEKEYYDSDVFFGGLVKGIETLKKQYEQPFYERKRELYFMLNGAKKGTLEYGNEDDKSIEERHKETIEYCNSELSQISFENYPLNLFGLTKNRFRGDLYFSEVLFIEAEITKANNEINKVIVLSRNVTKKALTNETYYKILEKCSIEAFESLKLKNLYPDNGTKAIWDVSKSTIQKGSGLNTSNDDKLFTDFNIRENMRVTFLTALESRCNKSIKKHTITREYFYKKCCQAIFAKVSQSPLWNEPDFGFDLNAEPSALSFIWSMRNDLECRSIEQDTNQQKHNKSKSTDLSDTNTLSVNKTVDFDPNHFNQKAYELFLYLLDNYKKDGKIKYINIFEFMKKGIDKKKYVFRFIQKDYKAFIISEYDVEIKKFKVAEFLYEDAEKGILNSHEQQFDGR